MRVAAIDIGTNSVLLLVAELWGRELVPVVERATITRLGRGVDATRTLGREGVDRTLECLARYADEIRASGAERVAAVGTSAMRDARGGAELVTRARDLLGTAPRVIEGGEEAALAFEGALSGLELDAEGKVVVFDVGGGSTEFVVGRVSGAVEDAKSLDLGSVRLTERHVRTDPPSPGELADVRRDARRALEAMPEAARVGSSSPVVGVAGTVTTLAAVALDVAPYDGARVHGRVIPRAELASVAERLAAMSLAERRALAAIDPARADVIVAGALLVDEILGRIGADALRVSDRGVRWGLAKRLAEGRS